MVADSPDLVRSVLARNNARADIIACTACPLRSNARQPVPFRGPTPARLMLVGEAIDSFEDKYNRLWIGRMPRWMDLQFKDHGLPSSDEWLIANTVNCVPPEGRPPSADEVHRCSRHMRATVQAADPEWVLTMGVIALHSVGVKGALKTFHGRPFFMPAGIFGGRWILPTFNPHATLRDDRKINDLSADLSTLSGLLKGTLSAESIAVRVGRNGKLMMPE